MEGTWCPEAPVARNKTGWSHHGGLHLLLHELLHPGLDFIFTVQQHLQSKLVSSICEPPTETRLGSIKLQHRTH